MPDFLSLPSRNLLSLISFLLPFYLIGRPAYSTTLLSETNLLRSWTELPRPASPRQRFKQKRKKEKWFVGV